MAGETVAASPYTLTATLSPAGVLDNYTITQYRGDLSRSSRDATWTTNAGEQDYGDPDPTR